MYFTIFHSNYYKAKLKSSKMKALNDILLNLQQNESKSLKTKFQK